MPTLHWVAWTSSIWWSKFSLLGQYRIMLSTDTASEVRQPPQRCLNRQAGIVQCCLRKKQQVGQVLPAAFLVCGRHTTHVVQKAKTAAVLQTTADSGGKKGIRTLEGFRGPTRFPVVRLRPAQPSFHIFSCAAPDCMSYYSNTNFKCQALFCIFLQKNLRWARCMQNVRANCIFCTFYPLANGGARC